MSSSPPGSSQITVGLLNAVTGRKKWWGLEAGKTHVWISDIKSYQTSYIPVRPVGGEKEREKDKEKTDNRCPTCGQRLHRLRTQRRRSLSQTQTPSTVRSLEDTKPPFCPLSGQLHGSYRSLGTTLITKINKKNMVLMFDRKFVFASGFSPQKIRLWNISSILIWNKSFLFTKKRDKACS